MGVIKQGILGGFSGSVANIVGSSWKGIAVVKSKPLSVANPRTAAQTAQRQRLAGVVTAARSLLAALIQPFWNPFAQRQSGYNAFVGENIDVFDNDQLSTPAQFYSTRGSLLSAPVTSGSSSAGGNTITLVFTDNSGQSDALGTDEVIATVYNETQDYWLVNAGNATRSDGTIVISDTNVESGDTLHTYLSFTRPNVAKVSDSVYEEITAGA